MTVDRGGGGGRVDRGGGMDVNKYVMIDHDHILYHIIITVLYLPIN